MCFAPALRSDRVFAQSCCVFVLLTIWSSAIPLFAQVNHGASQSELVRANRLLAHDINGFSLDMTVKQVADVAHSPLRSLGGGQYEVMVDGINYDFGFSVLGHLFRIDSKQQLGQFIPDGAFATTLTNKLSKKFGPPHTNQLPGGPAFWQFLDVYVDNDGQKLNRITESLSAMVGEEYGGTVSLQMTLMDFRIMRRDIEKLNTTPRSHAQSGIKF